MKAKELLGFQNNDIWQPSRSKIWFTVICTDNKATTELVSHFDAIENKKETERFGSNPDSKVTL